MIELYYFALITLIITLIAASFLDVQKRRVSFKIWYPLIIIGSISTFTFIYYNFYTLDLMTNVIIMASVLTFFILGMFNILGGADAWALIFITIFTVPFASSVSGDGIGISTYTNALILTAIIYPVYNYYHNRTAIKIYKDPWFYRSAPWYYMLFARKIDGSEITKHYGYILPDPYADTKTFFLDRQKVSNLLYTKKVIDKPDDYKKEIEMYQNYGGVWIINAMPFILYITIGFFITLFIGDLLSIIAEVII